MDLDTALLRALVALAEELHFGRAAARLGITQQALSKRIQRLESHLGSTLVDRGDRRSIRLTAAGYRAAGVAREVLQAVDRLDPGLERPAGRFRVDVLGDYLAPTTWLRRATRGADLSLDAVIRAADSTAEQSIRNREAELALGRVAAVPAPWPAWLRHRLLLLEPLAVLVPDGHPWSTLTEIPLERLADERLWFPMAAAPLEWRSYVADLSTTFDLRIDTTGSTFGYQQWAEDIGSGAAPPSLIGEAMRPPPGRVRIVPIVDPTPVFPWSAVWAADTPEQRIEPILRAMGFAVPAAAPGPEAWLPDADRAALRSAG